VLVQDLRKDRRLSSPHPQIIHNNIIIYIYIYIIIIIINLIKLNKIKKNESPECLPG
jgi:hypothetical protein